MQPSSNAMASSRRWRAVPWAWLIALGCAGLPLASPAAEPLVLQGIMKEMGRGMQAIVDREMDRCHHGLPRTTVLVTVAALNANRAGATLY